MFPDLLTPLESMPGDIKRHIRYPVDLLTVQAEMYSTYHMEDVQAFYQREDVWQFATERYRETFQKVVPYYVMVGLPGGEGIEFVLMLPFTPKNKNVVNAWMAGRSEVPHYGEIVVYSFPKGVEVLGPRQIEARIDQDTEMSRAMTLWGQRGSKVIRGNLLAIPPFHRDLFYLLYVEPIYLEAEDAQLPEVKRVVLADQKQVVWGESFEEAVGRLVGERAVPGARDERAAAGAAAGVAGQDLRPLIERAWVLLRSYRTNMGGGDFAEAGEDLEELGSVLGELQSDLGEGGE